MSQPVLMTSAVETTTLDAWLQELSERVHRQAVEATAPEMAESLQRIVGQRITGVMAGVEDAKAVGRWARAERKPRGESEQRLRAVFQIASLISTAESEATARAWFVGMNPHLADRAPFAVLGEHPEQAPSVLAAAKAFVVGN